MSGSRENGSGKITDPENKSQNHRIKTLLKRRDEVLEARDAAKDQFQLGDTPKIKAVQHYQSRLESLVLDLWTKFRSDMIETGEEYLKEKPIATVEVPPPAHLMPDERDLAANANLPEPKHEQITGLLWFKNNEPVITKSFSVQTWNPPGVQRDTNSVILDFSVIDDAVALCFEFMDETGIDANLSAPDYTGDEGPGI